MRTDRAMRALLVAVGVLVGAIVLASSALDEGEVVTLVTKSGDGVVHETPLWIVEWNGQVYLRAGSSRTEWLARLRAYPEVTLHRGDETLSFTAVPSDDPKTRAAINERMAAKYGFADRLWGHLSDRQRSVPILLEPRAGT
ncbi:MAG: hypothetical protein IT386_02495 [Deltaproteobacteria bacterium]|nr:hypothetical protein [Deltaproteobacteria bacterium]